MHLRSRRAEEGGGDRAGGTAGAVQHDAEPAEPSRPPENGGKIAFRKGGGGEDFPSLLGIGHHPSRDVLLDEPLPLARELFALTVKHLDAVVAGGIVGCGDHHSRACARLPCCVRDARRGHDVEVRDRRSRCRSPLRERTRKVAAARAGVPSDDDRPALCRSAQTVANQHGGAVRQPLAVYSSDAVRAEHRSRRSVH